MTRFGRWQITTIAIFLIALAYGRRTLSISNEPIPEIGAHTPLIKFEKNENPQNLMIVYTKLNAKTCAFEIGPSGPILDEYWLMDGKTFKKVHPLIKQGVADRLKFDRREYENSQRFVVQLRDFSELKSDLGSSPSFEVKPRKKGSGCEASVEMQLGPSDHQRKIIIESIYADSSKTLLPPFRKLQSLTINGKDLVSSADVHRTYTAN